MTEWKSRGKEKGIYKYIIVGTLLPECPRYLKKEARTPGDGCPYGVIEGWQVKDLVEWDGRFDFCGTGNPSPTVRTDDF